MLLHSALEAGVSNHRTEPVLDLARQAKKIRKILLSGESDDHQSSLAEAGCLMRYQLSGSRRVRLRRLAATVTNVARPPET